MEIHRLLFVRVEKTPSLQGRQDIQPTATVAWRDQRDGRGHGQTSSHMAGRGASGKSQEAQHTEESQRVKESMPRKETEV